MKYSILAKKYFQLVPKVPCHHLVTGYTVRVVSSLPFAFAGNILTQPTLICFPLSPLVVIKFRLQFPKSQFPVLPTTTATTTATHWSHYHPPGKYICGRPIIISPWPGGRASLFGAG